MRFPVPIQNPVERAARKVGGALGAMVDPRQDISDMYWSLTHPVDRVMGRGRAEEQQMRWPGMLPVKGALLPEKTVLNQEGGLQNALGALISQSRLEPAPPIDRASRMALRRHELGLGGTPMSAGAQGKLDLALRQRRSMELEMLRHKMRYDPGARKQARRFFAADQLADVIDELTGLSVPKRFDPTPRPPVPPRPR